MQVLAKIESADAVENLESILDAVDGAMVARGDLGAELPVQCVPFWQSAIVQVRASHLAVEALSDSIHENKLCNSCALGACVGLFVSSPSEACLAPPCGVLVAARF